MSITSGTSYLSSASVYATAPPSGSSVDSKSFITGIPQRNGVPQSSSGYLFRNVGEMFAAEDGTAGLLYNNAPPAPPHWSMTATVPTDFSSTNLRLPDHLSAYGHHQVASIGDFHSTSWIYPPPPIAPVASEPSALLLDTFSVNGAKPSIPSSTAMLYAYPSHPHNLHQRPILTRPDNRTVSSVASMPARLEQPVAPLPVRVFSCPTCGKQYCRKSTLKAHMKHHMGERPFVCQVCGKTFSQAANLTAHSRVHTGEKPFCCTICMRPFSQSSSLVTHKRTHTGERPYPCNHCDKAFTDSSTLTKHLRTHTGHKPYSCDLCLMRFSQSGNLNRHMKTHKAEMASAASSSDTKPSSHHLKLAKNRSHN